MSTTFISVVEDEECAQLLSFTERETKDYPRACLVVMSLENRYACAGMARTRTPRPTRAE